MTTTERFLQFLFGHQTLLIEILFALILGICVLWLFFHINDDSDELPPQNNADEIERAMEKVLEKIQTAVKPSGGTTETSPATAKPAVVASSGTPAPASTGTGAPTSTVSASISVPVSTSTPTSASTTAAPAPVTSGVTPTAQAAATSSGASPQPTQVPVSGATTVEISAEMQKLRAENAEKNQKLQSLEKAVSEAKAAAVAGPAVNVDEFQKKIKELEARLSEYEIIEDDIANLSLYKEENIRLKNELQKLKENSEGEEKPETGIDPEKLVAEAVALSEKPVTETVQTSKEGQDTGQKLIEEFENFMKDATR